MGKAKELAELANNLTVSGGAVTVSGFNYDNIVASAPGALDTLNELAAAIGDDANFSTTVTNSIATKMPLAGGDFAGSVTGLNNVGTAHNNGAIFDSTGTTQLWLRDTDATSNQRNWGIQVSGGDFNIVRANDDRASGFVTPIYMQQAPSNSLVILSSGNVGIGTASPGTKLHIDGGGSQPELRVAQNSTYFTDIGVNHIDVNGPNDLRFLMGGGEKVRIKSGGNVGIGTNNPGETLVVHGDGARLTVESADYEVAMLGRRGSSGSALDSGYLRLRKVGVTNTGVVLDTDGNSWLNGGNVGIGDSTPTSYANSQKILVIEDDTSPAIAWSDTGQSKDWFAVAMGSGLYFNYADGGGSSTASNVTSVLELGNTGAVAINGSGFYLKQDSSKSTIRSETQPIVLQTYGNSAWQDNVKVSNHTSEPILNVTGAGYGYTHGSIALKSDTGYDARVRGQGVYLFNEENDTTWYIGTPYLNTSAGSRPIDFNFKSSTTSLSTVTAHTDNTKARIHASGVISAPSGIELGSGVDATAANIIDYYEEGTWTPVLAGTTNAGTFYNRVGNYTRVGRLVVLQFFYQVGGTKPTFSNNSAAFSVTGIPFTVAGSGYTGSQGTAHCQNLNYTGSYNTQGMGAGYLTCGVTSSEELQFQTTNTLQTRGILNNLAATTTHWIMEATVSYFTDQ